MRAHIFQHISFEGPGNIEPWLKHNGYEISSTHFYKSVELPEPGDVDFLIIMGGPMSVNDEAGFPWLKAEKQYIRTCIEAGKPVLGICLGSQMIASALGAKVNPNPEKEIGWFPIQIIKSPNPQIFQFPNTFTPLHWHGETFDLPPGAVHIARSEGCENQAFRIGRNVIGLQFHPETTAESLQQMVANSGGDLRKSKYVQSREEILASGSGRFPALKKLMDNLLEELLTPTDNSKF